MFVNNQVNYHAFQRKILLTRKEELMKMRISELKKLFKSHLASNKTKLSQNEIQRDYNPITFIEKSDYVKAIISIEDKYGENK